MEVYDKKRNRFEKIEDRTQNNKYSPLSHCINKNKGDLSRNAQHGKNSIYTYEQNTFGGVAQITDFIFKNKYSFESNI